MGRYSVTTLWSALGCRELFVIIYWGLVSAGYDIISAYMLASPEVCTRHMELLHKISDKKAVKRTQTEPPSYIGTSVHLLPHFSAAHQQFAINSIA